MTYRIKCSIRTLKLYIVKIAKGKLPLLCYCMLGFICCKEVVSTPEPFLIQVVIPGEIILMGTKVIVNNTGTYEQPAKASRLTTQCFGKITISLNFADETTRSYTCQNPSGNTNETYCVGGTKELHFMA